MIGVYEIRNTVTGKAYIGASTNIKARWRTHRHLLRHQKHLNGQLQRDWLHYGEDKFYFSVIVEGVERKALGHLEQDYIDSHSDLYNVNEDVYDFTKRLCHSEETRRKMSDTHKGKTVSEETRKRLSEAQKGRTHSEETRRRMSEARKGKTLSEETREKISISRRGTKHPMSKLTWEKVREIRRLYAAGGVSQSKLGRQFGIAQSAIHRIVNNQRWIEE